MNIKQFQAEHNIFFRWVSFGSYGMAIGILIAFLIYVALSVLLGNFFHLEKPIWEMVPFILSGLTLGTFLGIFQSIAIKRQVVRPILWILASGIGLAIGIPCAAYLYLNNILPEAFLSFLAMGAILGLVLGFSQWLILRTKAVGSSLWIFASVVGGVLSVIALYFLTILGDFAFPTQYYPDPPGIVNTILGIITGILELVFILLFSPLVIGVSYNVSTGIIIKRFLDTYTDETQKAG